MVKIVEMDNALSKQAHKLIFRVFPHESILGIPLFFFWVYKKRRNPVIKKIGKLLGLADFSQFWVVIDDNGNVIGTTGLFTFNKDESEAVWLSWFCVAPEQRRRGIGKKLIEFSIQAAKKQGKKFLRLYTANFPSMAAAQLLYEKYGLKIVKTENKWFFLRINRELAL